MLHMLLFYVQENVVSIDATIYHHKLGSGHLILVGEGLGKSLLMEKNAPPPFE